MIYVALIVLLMPLRHLIHLARGSAIPGSLSHAPFGRLRIGFTRIDSELQLCKILEQVYASDSDRDKQKRRVGESF